MRQFTLLLTPEDGAFHPTDQALKEHPAVTQDVLVHTDLLPDGTAIATAFLSGDPAAARSVLDEEPTALSYDISEVDENRFHLYVHFEEAGSATSLLRVVEEHRLFIVPPLEYTDEGLRVTLAGTQERVRKAAGAVPRDITVRLCETKNGPENDDMVSRLTERQRDVLATALELGYYETPRRATHADVAEVLGCSTGTVGEHLRKIESAVLSNLSS